MVAVKQDDLSDVPMPPSLSTNSKEIKREK
jgi:hypothetical protein